MSFNLRLKNLSMPLNIPIADFNNKNVWIIGASSGIGEACAQWMVHRGANVFISARREELLHLLVSKLKPLNNTASIHCLSLDVTDENSVHKAVGHVLEVWDHIDVVLFVSGIYTPIRAENFDYQISKKMVQTNLLGPMLVVSSLMPQLLKQQFGHIALVGSVAGYSGLPQSLVYGPTKAALLNFSESLYYDLKPHGISVHIISPGFVKTPATDQNDFHMPALISAQDAANAIGQGLSKGEFDIHFPKRFSRFLKFLRILPYPLYFWIVRRFVKI